MSRPSHANREHFFEAKSAPGYLCSRNLGRSHDATARFADRWIGDALAANGRLVQKRRRADGRPAPQQRSISGENDEIPFPPRRRSAISGPWAYPALAQFGSLTIDSCDDYIARATSQVQIATGCNFGGPRWSPDSVEHMNWCKRASSKDRGREYDERRKALIGCRGYSGVE